MKKLVTIFKALSDPNRVRIMKMLESRKLCLCEVSSVLKLANSTVSKHLSILKDAGLIIDDKEGKWVNYELVRSPESVYVQDMLALFIKYLNNDITIKNDLKLVNKVDRKIICGVD
ncbi:MAG TPA: metalloregulator ArsR/SmtB family transcription factor [Ignavibacteriaceae bacterium]|jgi:ArsR family transcriptional regulator|nr:metalloregulator ArsR/SmtB family transcription factor [Ignavibacteriaceae bacterium]HOJ18229.1 metalloregulator ArsR/SmtB family transcription factor [Ignavibacteriaceae bacterium]